MTFRHVVGKSSPEACAMRHSLSRSSGDMRDLLPAPSRERTPDWARIGPGPQVCQILRLGDKARVRTNAYGSGSPVRAGRARLTPLGPAPSVASETAD